MVIQKKPPSAKLWGWLLLALVSGLVFLSLFHTVSKVLDMPIVYVSSLTGKPVAVETPQGISSVKANTVLPEKYEIVRVP